MLKYIDNISPIHVVIMSDPCKLGRMKKLKITKITFPQKEYPKIRQNVRPTYFKIKFDLNSEKTLKTGLPADCSEREVEVFVF